MSTRNTFIMGVVLLALVSLFMFGKPSKVQPGDQSAVFSWESDDVSSLTLDRAIGPRPGSTPAPSGSGSPSASPSQGPRSRQKLVFEKQNGHWIMTAPLHCLVSGGDMSVFLGNLAGLRSVETVEKNDAALFGFNDPDVIFEVKTKDGTHKLTLGALTVTDQGYYATADTQKNVLITGQSLTPMISKSAELWREKAPLDIETNQVTKWSLVRNNQTITVEKDKDGHWQMTQPVAVKADEQMSANVLTQTRNIQIKTFPTDVKADDARLQPTATLSVWTRTGGTVPNTLTIGSQDPKTHDWYALRSPLQEVIMIPDKNLWPLRQTAESLQDKHVLAFEMSDVTQVHMTGSSTDLVAKKEGLDWTISKPAGVKDDLKKVSNAVDHIHNMNWTKRLTGKDATTDLGFDKPQLVVVLTLGPDHINTLQFGKNTATHGVLVRLSEHPETAYEVSDTSLTFLNNIASTLVSAAKASPSAGAGAGASASASATPSAPGISGTASVIPSIVLSPAPK